MIGKIFEFKKRFKLVKTYWKLIFGKEDILKNKSQIKKIDTKISFRRQATITFLFTLFWSAIIIITGLILQSTFLEYKTIIDNAFAIILLISYIPLFSSIFAISHYKITEKDFLLLWTSLVLKEHNPKHCEDTLDLLTSKIYVRNRILKKELYSPSNDFACEFKIFLYNLYIPLIANCFEFKIINKKNFQT